MLEDELLDDGFGNENDNKIGSVKRLFTVLNSISLLLIIYFAISAFINQGLGSLSSDYQIIWYIHSALVIWTPLVSCAYSVYLFFHKNSGKQQIWNYIDFFLVFSPWVYWLIFVFGLIIPWAE